MTDKLQPIEEKLLRRGRSADRGNSREMLAFRLGEMAYAIDIARVQSIVKIPPLTPVPRAPVGVMGIVGVRGRVLTVIDIRERLKAQVTEPSRTSRLLVVPVEGQDLVGVYVDEVLHVVRFLPHQIEPASRLVGSETSEEHLIGIGRKHDQMVVLIDLKPIVR
jgi:purine-binding chemotaxis protein CheW